MNFGGGVGKERRKEVRKKGGWGLGGRGRRNEIGRREKEGKVEKRKNLYILFPE